MTNLSTVQVPLSGDNKETTAPAGGCILFPRRLESKSAIPLKKLIKINNGNHKKFSNVLIPFSKVRGNRELSVDTLVKFTGNTILPPEILVSQSLKTTQPRRPNNYGTSR